MTYSGWLTHISGHPSATSRAQDSESTSAKVDRCSIPLDHTTNYGTEDMLSPDDIVIDGDPAPSPKRGQSPPIFGPRLLWPNGCMDQDVSWHGGRPGPTRHCVRWRHNYAQKKGTPTPPNFGPCLLWHSGWVDEDATWCGSRPRPRPHCIRQVGETGSQLSAKGAQQPPSFRPMSIVATVAHQLRSC